MKKLISLLITIQVITSGIFAQAPPKKMSYQAIIRNVSNVLVTSTMVGMRITIQGCPGPIVYQETQTPTADANGLVSLVIGDGTVISGNISLIDWSTGPYCITTETDPAGGTAYCITGTSQLLSVPYALFAGNIPGGKFWSLTGNTGTIDSINFIGTTDSIPFNIRVNNKKAGRIDHILYNAFYGYLAGSSNTTGNFNTAIGGDALRSNTTGGFNTAIGSGALSYNINGIGNTANGVNALSYNTSGNNNTAVGGAALYLNGAGFENTAVGSQALYFNTASQNTAVGMNALYTNSLGGANTAIGNAALYFNTAGSGNTAIGISALEANTTGGENTVIGSYALWKNTTGIQNTAIGNQTLSTNTTGRNNAACGRGGLFKNTTGSSNTSNGSYALFSNTSGANNTANGDSALFSNTTGNFNTALGYSANVSSGTLTNATAIGSNAIVNSSNKIRLGDATVTVIEGQVAYTFPSDGRFKTNISDNDVKGLDFIKRLRPVVYNFDTKKYQGFLTKNMTDSLHQRYMDNDFSASTAIRQSGFIAQEVEKAAQEAGYSFNGIHKPENEDDHYSLAYSQFVVPLVKAMQEQQQMIDDQQKKIDQQQLQINQLKKLIESTLQIGELRKQVTDETAKK